MMQSFLVFLSALASMPRDKRDTWPSCHISLLTSAPASAHTYAWSATLSEIGMKWGDIASALPRDLWRGAGPLTTKLPDLFLLLGWKFSDMIVIEVNTSNKIDFFLKVLFMHHIVIKFPWEKVRDLFFDGLIGDLWGASNGTVTFRVRSSSIFKTTGSTTRGNIIWEFICWKLFQLRINLVLS